MKKLLLIVVFATVVFGQFSPFGGIPSDYGYNNGAWVEYQSTDENGKVTKMRVAIVGEENQKGTAYNWYEIRNLDVESGDRDITKILTSGDPEKQAEAMKIVTQHNDDPPTEIKFNITNINIGNNDETGGNMEEPDVSSGYEAADADAYFSTNGYTQKPNISVTVPAGTFEADYYSIEDENGKVEYWLSEKVAFSGVIKMSSTESGTMELIGYGNDGATSEITGNVQSIDLGKEVEKSIGSGLFNAIQKLGEEE